MRSMRRILILMTLLGCAFVPLARGQAPKSAVKLIVPYTPGGTADTIARMVGQRMGELWSQPVVIDNRGGAGGIIGTEAAAKAAPDGLTLYLGTDGPISINPSIYASLPYDWRRDFAPISLLATVNQVVVVPASLPARSLQEFFALARRSPKKLNYASIGIGSPPHLAAELLKAQADIDLTHVPYKGVAQVIAALLADESQLAFLGEQTVAPLVKAGKLFPIGTTGKKRTFAFPDVPTVAEGGLPNFETKVWYALFAPAATPEAILRRYHADIAKLMDAADLRDALVARGFTPQSSTPEALRVLALDEQQKWAVLIAKLGIKPQ